MVSTIGAVNLSKLITNNVILTFVRTAANSRPSETVLIEKCLEHPVIVLREQDDVDIIGPADALSNLRPVIRKRLLNETALQQRLRELQDATQAWNQEFWSKHNTNFITKKQEYINQHQIQGSDTVQLTADEMSEFYKKFLDDNWKMHVNYNMEWYKKNFSLLFLALRVAVEKSIVKFS